MTLIVKRCGAPCSPGYTACGSGTCYVECQSKNLGYVSLCGIPAYDDSGRCFRNEAQAVDYKACGYAEAGGCGTFTASGSEKVVCNGSRVYDPLTCSNVTHGAHYIQYRPEVPATCEDDAAWPIFTEGDLSDCPPIDFPAGCPQSDLSAVADNFECTEACVVGVFPGSMTAFGFSTKTLSNEVFVDDIIAGRLAALAWTSGDCAAIYSEAAPVLSGGTVIYADVRWQVGDSGLIPASVHAYGFEYWRRTVTFNALTFNWDYGAWELFSTGTMNGVADSSGNLLTAFAVIPNEQGFETMVVVPACSGPEVPV